MENSDRFYGPHHRNYIAHTSVFYVFSLFITFQRISLLFSTQADDLGRFGRKLSRSEMSGQFGRGGEAQARLGFHRGEKGVKELPGMLISEMGASERVLIQRM